MTTVDDRTYEAALERAAAVLRRAGEVQPYDPEWLVRRGNWWTIITPEIAAELLERNRSNRRPKRRAIALYARDMREGDWNPDASDLKVARNGDLLDGQNRLMACIEAGVPFPTLLRTGLDPQARDHVDQGVRRTAGDTLYMAGLADPNNIAAAINLRVRYERTVVEFGGRQALDRRAPMTHAQVLNYLAGHPSFERMLPLATRMQREGPGVPRSVYVCALAWFAESSEKLAREFAEVFISGESTGTGDPMLALARYLARAKSPTELRLKSRSRSLQHLLAFILAWNAWVGKEFMERITARDSDLLVLPL